MTAFSLTHRQWVMALVVLLACLCAQGAGAQDVALTATVDRATIRENESFTYTIRVEGSARAEPDASALEADFDVLNRASSTRIQIINGRTEQVAEWQYSLMPRRSGRLVLPAVTVGNVRSNEIEVDVRPAPPPGTAVADIFMEVEANPGRAYVQSQVVFTLRLFIGVGTGRATLSTPEVEGVEAIIERLGEDTQYQVQRDDRDFIVRERRYAIFPQEAGTLSIGPVTFEAMVIPNRGFSRVQRFSSSTASVEVLPAVAPPQAYPNAVWLPARRLVLRDRWSGDTGDLEVGIPQTRTVTIEADGLLETQLPALALEVTDGLRQYADQPEMDRVTSESGLTVQRTERFAVIAQRDGELDLPAIEMPWWNVTTGRWEVARLDARVLTVAPSAELPPAAPPVAPEQGAAPAPAERGVPTWLAVLLGLGWAATALAWVFAGRLGRWGARARGAIEAQGAGLGAAQRRMAQIKSACRANDAAAAQRGLLAWAQLEFPGAAVTSLGGLARRLSAEAGAAVLELERALYGGTSEHWDGASLASALAAADASRKDGPGPAKSALPPLYR